MPLFTRLTRLVARAFGGLLLAVPALALAQTAAPAWRLATSGSNTQGGPGISLIAASATDASGNVFVTGYFTSTVTFGTTSLTSAGLADVFVAKWDVTAQAYTWAVRGGGTGNDLGEAIAISDQNVYVTGYFNSGFGAAIAGQALPGTGTNNSEVFVAKYYDTSTGHTAATSSVANGWATSGGGTGTDNGFGIAVQGNSVYVTGAFTSNNAVVIAGQALTGAGDSDVFVAKYVDTSTGTTPATSSYRNGWVATGGGTGTDYGNAIAVSGSGVYVTGAATSVPGATIAGQALPGTNSLNMFVAKFIDTSTGSTPATSSYANGWAASGGSPGGDQGYAIALGGKGIYVAGSFTSLPGATIAGQALTSAGGGDLFVAKYYDTSTGNTPATSSYANGWAVSGGGSNYDVAYGLAVSGTSVYVGGHFYSGTGAVIAGQALPGTGTANYDVFLAKYTDTSTGTTPATSSVTPAWATSGGSSDFDFGYTVAVSGQQVYLGGSVVPPATFGPITFGVAGSGGVNFLAGITDLALPLPAAQAAVQAVPGLRLYPNPTTGRATLTGAAPGTAVQVLDALGRVAATTTADATGTAALPASLAPGVYVVRAGAGAARLVVE